MITDPELLAYLQKQREFSKCKTRRSQLKRTINGQCISCPNEALENRTHCQPCVDKARNRHRLKVGISLDAPLDPTRGRRRTKPAQA